MAGNYLIVAVAMALLDGAGIAILHVEVGLGKVVKYPTCREGPGHGADSTIIHVEAACTRSWYYYPT